MGVMFPLLAGCRLMFTAIIMVDITVVKHSLSVGGKAILAQWRDTVFCATVLLYGIVASPVTVNGLRP